MKVKKKDVGSQVKIKEKLKDVGITSNDQRKEKEYSDCKQR